MTECCYVVIHDLPSRTSVPIEFNTKADALCKVRAYISAHARPFTCREHSDRFLEWYDSEDTVWIELTCIHKE